MGVSLDHFQRFMTRQLHHVIQGNPTLHKPRGEGVAKVVKPYVLEPSPVSGPGETRLNGPHHFAPKCEYRPRFHRTYGSNDGTSSVAQPNQTVFAIFGALEHRTLVRQINLPPI